MINKLSTITFFTLIGISIIFLLIQTPNANAITYTVSINPISQVRWNSGNLLNWFDDQFTVQGNTFNEIKSLQINSGNVTKITILPIINPQEGDTIISLYKNGINTTKTVIIQAGSTALINMTLNYQFNSGDYINWIITTHKPNQKFLVFNVRQVFSYTNYVDTSKDTNTAQIKNADNALEGLFGSRTNLTQNTIKTIGNNGPNVKVTSNSTHIFINANNTAQLGCADNGECLVGSHPNSTKNNVKTLRNATNYMNFNHNDTSITPTFLFKINSVNCGANQAVVILNNSTISSCSNFLTVAVTSINGSSGPVNINAHDPLLTSSISNGLITISTKPNRITNNDTNQRIIPQITLQNPELNGFACSERWKTSAYTVTPYDCTLEVNATTGSDPTVITLPAVSTMINDTILIKKIDWSTKTVKIVSTVPNLIDLWKNINLTNQGDYIALLDNKTNWIIVDQTAKDFNSFHIKGISPNKWYSSQTNFITNATFIPVANNIYATQLITSSPIKLDQIRIGVITSGASSLCRAGIYTSNSTLTPNVLIIGSDTGTFTTSTTGIKTNTFTTPIILQGNSLYYIGINCQATVPSLTGLPQGSFNSILGQNSTRMGGQQELQGWRGHYTFNTMPIVFPVNATTQASIMPMIQVRIIG